MTTPKYNEYQYKVNYNDHFETPLIAYQDILPLLDAIQPSSDSSNNENQESLRACHILYDPYYCDGQTKRHMQTLGFSKVQHEKRDFYNDIEKNQVPEYHTFLTNPPYSGDHKEKCVRYAISKLRPKQVGNMITDGKKVLINDKDDSDNGNGVCVNDSDGMAKPFFILMPNYVACRNYFRTAILSGIKDSDQADPLDILYVVPSTPYEYDHPEGTGHDQPPFFSIWFCGIPSDRVQSAKKAFRKAHEGKSYSPRLVSTLAELKEFGCVPTMKRKNLKQRLKSKLKLHKLGTTNVNATAKLFQTNTPTIASSQNTKENSLMASSRKRNSKYRDENGTRKKKRF